MLYFQVPDTEGMEQIEARTYAFLSTAASETSTVFRYVLDINTGESLGQYFDGEWKDNYRYHRGLSPTGSEVTDKVTGTKYKVKVLNGEEFLSLAPDAKGTVTYTATPADLVPDELMVDVGPNGGDNFIGGQTKR